ncbi:MAG: hypothetical protein IPK12_19515 [Gemmatimonadetes bacterium]|nr:hypothetical protein [Gemmatimonadota bacterium]
MVKLGEEVFHPADVLNNLAPDAARRGRDDAFLQVRTELEQSVCEQFPAPIAIPFHGFLEGPRQSLQRLHRLRDTWESIVRLLTALALSEAARFAPSLRPLMVRDGKDQRWRECRRRDLYSDKLAVRIGLIEGVLHRAEEEGIELHVASLVPLEVLAEVRRLNVVRNGFSHEATKSDAQAQAIIDEAHPIVREVLLDLRDIQSIELLRIHTIQAGGRAEVEKLRGHAQSRRIRDLPLDSDAASVAMSATPVDGMSRVLARLGGLTLDLSPFLYTVDDDTGHRTRILDFKSKKGDDWHLECVADSTTKMSPALQHESLLVRLEDLLAPSGEGA